MRNVKTAVSISAYNRPEYFKQVVESLEKNLESSFLDFYFFLDGGQESAQQENAKIKVRMPSQYEFHEDIQNRGPSTMNIP